MNNFLFPTNKSNLKYYRKLVFNGYLMLSKYFLPELISFGYYYCSSNTLKSKILFMAI